jgi:glycosyltransferase involved in cell wall biosynthesis
VKGSVLIIGNFLSGAGGSRGVCEELAQRLEERDWQLLTASAKRPKILRIADMLLTVWKQREQYAVAQVDVFSGPAFFWAEAVCSLLRRLGKPYVLTLHGGNLPQFAKRRPGRVRRLLSSAKAVTAPSGYLKEAIEPYLRGGLLGTTPSTSIDLVPNPIEIKAYPYRERGPARPKLVWLRAFHEIYNPVMAVKVVGALTARYPEIHLNMVGPDKGDGSFERTRAEIAAAGLIERISFSGQVAKKEVPRVLSEADIFLYTTNIDNTPVSVIEAMACGLCVVTTRVGGTPFLVSDGEDGLLVECGNAPAMADAVDRLLENEHLAARCSRNARLKVESWDWARVLPRWESVLRNAMNYVGARSLEGDARPLTPSLSSSYGERGRPRAVHKAAPAT